MTHQAYPPAPTVPRRRSEGGGNILGPAAALAIVEQRAPALRELRDHLGLDHVGGVLRRVDHPARTAHTVAFAMRACAKQLRACHLERTNQ